MPDIAEPIFPGNNRFGAAGPSGERPGDVDQGPWIPARDVECAKAGPVVLESRHVGPRDVRHMRVATQLGAVLIDIGRLMTVERGSECRYGSRIWTAIRNSGPIDAMVPKRHACAAGLARPDGAQVLLRVFCRRVYISRLGQVVLKDDLWGEC